MLILTRKSGEGISIGPSVRVVVLEVKGSSVRLGIEAPEGVRVHRDEVLRRIEEENRNAMENPRESVSGSVPLAAGTTDKGREAMSTFRTVRFGEIPVAMSGVIRFPDGLPGFPQAHRFLLLETGEAQVFYWLQSLDDPALAFVVMDPALLVPDYMDRLVLPEWDREFFAPLAATSLTAMVIVTFSGETATANLLAPLLVREEERLGRQVILAESEEWLRQPVFLPKKSSETP
ncbi:MAG: carbon storage regulator CsrA [Leptospirillia bacterium]